AGRGCLLSQPQRLLPSSLELEGRRQSAPCLTQAGPVVAPPTLLGRLSPGGDRLAQVPGQLRARGKVLDEVHSLALLGCVRPKLEGPARGLRSVPVCVDA